MSIQIRLWLGEGTDLLALRNHIFEKCGCDYELPLLRENSHAHEFSTLPESLRAAISGPSYEIGNSHNMIQINLRPMFGGEGLNLRLGCHVGYTLNAKSKDEAWLHESLAASISAVLTFPGDAVLAIQQIAVLYRKGGETYVDPTSTVPLAHFVLNDSLAQACIEEVISHLSRANSAFRTKSFEGLDLGV